MAGNPQGGPPDTVGAAWDGLAYFWNVTVDAQLWQMLQAINGIDGILTGVWHN